MQLHVAGQIRLANLQERARPECGFIKYSYSILLLQLERTGTGMTTYIYMYMLALPRSTCRVFPLYCP